MSSNVLVRVLGPGFDAALDRVRAALATEGFGVLTEVDVKDTLKKKLDVDFRRYKILGACNPRFAHEALGKEPMMGLVMPCSVIVYERDDGQVVVSAVDPTKSVLTVGNESLVPLAAGVRDKLAAAMKVLDAAP